MTLCRTISKGAPIIVALNLWLILALKKLIALLLPGLIWNDIIGLLTAISVVVICYFLTLFFDKYLSFALGFRKINYVK